MKRATPLSLAAAIVVCALPAWAQQPPKDPFNGKVKAGKYEDRVEIDMSSLPGVPKGQGKEVRTTQRCFTQEQLDAGIAGSHKGCEHSGYKLSGDTASYNTVCKQGGETQTMETRITVTPTGFRSELKNTMSKGGQSFTSTMKSESRYLGPCT
jgi:hypothetical protein